MPAPTTAAADAGSGLLTAHFPALYRELVRFIARRTGNDDEARDLAHDTWLRLAEHERAPGATAPGNTRAYLFTVAHHLALDHLRRNRLQRGEASGLDKVAPDVADSVMYRQAVQTVEAALQELPARARDVFLQHRLMGVGQAELAERHGLSRNMIERDVMLAMDCVQVAMEHWRGATMADGQVAARKGRRRSLAALLGVAGFCGSGGLAWQLWRSEVPQWQLALATRRGQTLRQPLPDGSVLSLDALSAAELTYYAARRSVALRAGAAFFDVARDADRPFVVDAGNARITVPGTRFGVEIANDRVDVQVESGRVQVQALAGHDGRAAEPVLLGAGQALRVVSSAAAGGAASYAALPHVAAGAVAPWRNGALWFDATPLSDAVQRLARYGSGAVTVAPEVATLPVSGQVRISQAQDWLAALPAVLPVRVSQSAEGWHIAGR
ncbi:sigma-70 family RNA polymerase sigma factor [Sphaerotilus sp.]|uniref:sigma-70 family RNA polymerase sigma factor n=1 Tax=Sphaerotilus sp. TaxID=2093942 RepID=UPI002ACEEFA2|nr:sigma-70 family RNA polymerase sigma factor [Sphaerotilus sp.]MDZ7855904.1 sigma-70 family RNA polymerase sigma factor [Sphaerotilus sp.]